MNRLTFHVNADNPIAVETRNRLADCAANYGFEVVPTESAEAIIALGGDGTFLKAVRSSGGKPVLGFNLGSLGYLASVGENDFSSALQKLAEGKYLISERRMLEVNGKHMALNDIAVVREMSGHAARLDLEADGKLVTRYMADGLIFATPTGSTAYSLAAGGPVLMPDSASFVVTPMNPHALGVRPLVLNDNVRLVVKAVARSLGNPMKVGVYADGENVLTLESGDMVEIAKSKQTAKLIELEGYNPYEVLARKLGWSGSNVK